MYILYFCFTSQFQTRHDFYFLRFNEMLNFFEYRITSSNIYYANQNSYSCYIYRILIGHHIYEFNLAMNISLQTVRCKCVNFLLRKIEINKVHFSIYFLYNAKCEFKVPNTASVTRFYIMQ